MAQKIQFFHHSVNGMGQEVASAELPGELWPEIDELAGRQQDLFVAYLPPEMAQNGQEGRALDLARYLKLKETPGIAVAPPFLALAPFAERALDLGYNYLVLTA